MQFFPITLCVASLISCLLIVILGFISPLYQQYPNKVQVRIAQCLVAIDLLSFFHCQVVDVILACLAIAYFSLNEIFLYELWRSLCSPFCTPKTRRYTHLAVYLYNSIYCIEIILFSNLFDWQQQANKVIRSAFIRGIQICVIFLIKIYYNLRSAQALEDPYVNQLKNTYFKRQGIWFLVVCVLEMTAYYNPSSRINDIMIQILGLVFSLTQLTQKFPYLRLKCFFLRPWCSAFEINLVHQLESGEIEDRNLTPTALLLKNAQLAELVKGILLSIRNASYNGWYAMGAKQPKRIFKFNLNLNLNINPCLNPVKQSFSKAIIKSYYHDHFLELMKRNGLTQDLIFQTLDVIQNQAAIKKTKESLGRSGAFFFFSQNNIFILKTISKSELKSFLNKRIILYLNHLHNNPATLLANIFGLYKIKLTSFSPTYLILMENSFYQMNHIGPPTRLYDLKGSTKNRTSKESSSVKKDNNFLSSPDRPIRLPRGICNMLLSQAEADSQFLRSINYMDYSLLVGIRDCDYESRREGQYPRLILSGCTYYTFSIIDYLQVFNCEKKLELGYKSIKTSKEKLSCVQPDEYRSRFTSFLANVITPTE